MLVCLLLPQTAIQAVWEQHTCAVQGPSATAYRNSKSIINYTCRTSLVSPDSISYVMACRDYACIAGGESAYMHYSCNRQTCLLLQVFQGAGTLSK